MNCKEIKVIAFDADDTLWVNETFFREAEVAFAERLTDYLPQEEIIKILLDTEINNLHNYGYGIKGFVLSLLEAAQKITKGNVTDELVSFIIDRGKQMLHEPVEVLDGVEEVLQKLVGKYRLVVATKGDLLDQERKLVKSGLIDYFHHIEIVSDKKETQYRKLVDHLDIAPKQFMMVGNSLKSDVLPVLAMGGSAVHIPFHTTWEHEQVLGEIDHKRFKTLDNARELVTLLLG